MNFNSQWQRFAANIHLKIALKSKLKRETDDTGQLRSEP